MCSVSRLHLSLPRAICYAEHSLRHFLIKHERTFSYDKEPNLKQQ